MTQVLLVRHAEAVEAEVASGDSLRWLTHAGRRSMHRVGEALAGAHVGCERLVTSPLVRAVQTAEILAAAMGFEGAIEAHRALASGTTAEIAALVEGAGEGPVVLVGHEPSIRVAASQLSRVSLPAFRTGAACLVDWDGQTGGFRWLLDPRTLTRAQDLGDLLA